MNNTELYHYGVKGMRWGVHKNKYVTVRQGLKNARTAGQEAWRKSVSDNGGTLIGKSKQLAVYKSPAAKFRGKKAAREAYNNAYKNSVNNDKVHNKQLRADAKASNPNRKREIAIATTAVVGTALTAYGVYKVSNAIKQKDFKRRMDGGMKYLEFMGSKGRFDIGMDELKSSMNDGMKANTFSIIKQTIENNTTPGSGKVDWKRVGKRLNPFT